MRASHTCKPARPQLQLPASALAALTILTAFSCSCCAASVHNISSLSTHRFPTEGVAPPVVLCTEPPLAGSGPFSARIQQAGVTLRYPTRAHGFSLAAPTNNGTGCFSIEAGAVANAGPGLLSVGAPGASSTQVEVEYYESVSVAFGLRPYLGEVAGTLLLRPDREVLAAASAPGGSPVAVEMALPFATPPRTERWTATPGGGPLLQQAEQVLAFELAGLPATVNQDVRITVSLPSGRKITKWRRLMRAPPLPHGSFVQAVQVDHSPECPCSRSRCL